MTGGKYCLLKLLQFGGLHMQIADVPQDFSMQPIQSDTCG